jgi:segregation and condensation protein A
VLLGLGAAQFAELAGRALTPRPPAVVSIAHLHSPTVSVREQVAILRDRLRRSGAATFRSLTADCTATVEIVARFLALLDLFRDGCIAFEQVTALGDLLVRWTLQDDVEGGVDGAAGGQGTAAQLVDTSVAIELDPTPSTVDD